MPGKIHPQHVKDAVLQDYRAKVKLADIAAKHGVSISTVDLWRKQAGLSRHQKRAKKAPKRDVLALTGGKWVKGPDGVSRWVEEKPVPVEEEKAS
jgi:transposase-like protein